MIILDLSQVMIANYMAQVGNHAGEPLDVNLFRHMVLNTIRANKVKFGITFGELVIACDDKKPWRKDIFQHYKANRKKTRDESGIDWSSIFNTLNKIKLEIKENFPYRVIQVEGAEADDVIGTLVNNYDDRILILSGDKDFKQLQVYPRVEQYDPIRKKYLLEPNPVEQLKELIIKGDIGDGVPNVLSPDNSLVDDIRQKKIMKAKLADWVKLPFEELENDTLLGKGFRRNRELIDLSKTPDSIKDKIIEEFKNQANKKRDMIFNYLINNKCKQLVEHVNEF
jgi:hypothetical protein